MATANIKDTKRIRTKNPLSEDEVDKKKVNVEKDIIPEEDIQDMDTESELDSSFINEGAQELEAIITANGNNHNYTVVSRVKDNKVENNGNNGNNSNSKKNKKKNNSNGNNSTNTEKLEDGRNKERDQAQVKDINGKENNININNNKPGNSKEDLVCSNDKDKCDFKVEKVVEKEGVPQGHGKSPIKEIHDSKVIDQRNTTEKDSQREIDSTNTNVRDRDSKIENISDSDTKLRDRDSDTQRDSDSTNVHSVNSSVNSVNKEDVNTKRDRDSSKNISSNQEIRQNTKNPENADVKGTTIRQNTGTPKNADAKGSTV